MNAVVPFVFWRALLAAAAGYLLGNLQTAIIVSKCYYHDDVRNHGSGNAGSTNMVRVFGFGPGAVTFAGDFLKAVLGVLAGQLLMGLHGGYLAGFMVVLGHCYPCFAKFRGGKGVASSCGLAFMTNPLGAACSLAVGVLLLALTKRVSVASLTCIVLFFVSVLVFMGNDTALIVMAALMVVVVYVRHLDNIRRLLRHEEPKFIPKSK